MDDLDKILAQALAETQAQPYQPSRTSAGVGGLTRGVLMGWDDEMAGGLRSILPGGGTYEEERDRYRMEADADRTAHPVIGGASALAGGIGTGVIGGAPAAAATAGRGLLARLIAGGAVGSAEGALMGAGDDHEGDRTDGARAGAMLGAAVGGVAVPIAGAVGKGVQALTPTARQGRAAIRNAPSPTDLRSQADAIFDRADQVTGLDRSVLTGAAPGIVDRAERLGMDHVLTPQSHRAAERLTDEATLPNPNVSFRDLDILRRQSQVPASSKVPTEAAIGSHLVGSMDDVIATADPRLGKEVADAREMWGRMRRTEQLDAAMARAENQASGAENGLRNQFRSILNDPRKRSGYSAAEIAAMERVVRGDFATNAMRFIGTMGAPVDQGRNFLGAMLSSGAGFGVGGPVGAIAAPAAGTVAKLLAEKMTRSAAQTARNTAAAGQSAVPAPQELSAVQRAILEAMMRQPQQRAGLTISQ